MAPTHNLHSTMNDLSSASVHVPNELRFRNQQTMKSGNVKPTLQSVLRGEIPSAYMHLVKKYRTDRPSQVRNPRLHSMLTGESDRCRQIQGSEFESYIPRFQASSSHLPHGGLPESPPDNRWSPHEQPPASYTESNTSLGVHGSSPHESSPSSNLYHDRYSPAFESRLSPFSESGSPFLSQETSSYYRGNSPHRVCSPYRQSSSPYLPPHSPSAPFTYGINDDSLDMKETFSNDQPIDLSTKSEQVGHSHDFCGEISESQCSQNDGSLLRNLLSFGKNRDSKFEAERDSPLPETFRQDVPVTGTTRVTLAKKMMYPITSRVSDWLVKIVQFAKSIPEFSSMSQNDKLTLLINSWTRLLLLLMAENDFEFAVTPLPADKQNSDVTPSQDEPTMKSVDGVQTFIKKCRNMTLDQKEYALLRMSVLFNAGYVGLDKPELVEKLNSAVQQLLQQHVTATRPGDAMHYSRILMCLPSLYGINCKMVENLFCARINSNMDMEVLIKEMLQNL